MTSLTPFDDEGAKAVGEVAGFGKAAVETARAAGGYAARVLGNLPEDLVGWAIGDRVAAARWEQAHRLHHDAQERLRTRGVKETVKLSPALAAPLLDAATDENREELADLWARLLANALDPARTRRVRLRFIEVIKKMDPLDARVFQQFVDFPGGMQPTARDFIASHLEAAPDEVAVSFNNLSDFELVAATPGTVVGAQAGFELSNVHLTPIGRQFAQAVAP